MADPELQAARAQLAGVDVPALAAVGWTLKPGSSPHQQLVQVDLATAARIETATKEAGGQTELVLQGPRKEVRAKRVYVLGRTTPTRPDTATLVLSDRRWLWSRRWVYRRYNVPRRTGTKRRVGRNYVTSSLVDTIAYYPGSLKDGVKKWTAVEVLRDVLTQVGVPESDRRILSSFRNQIAVEDLFLDDAGDAALDRVMALLPGIGVTVDLDGLVAIYEVLNREERYAAQQASVSVYGSGAVTEVDVPAAKPIAVRVLFEQRVEFRFNFRDGLTHTLTRDELDLWMTNVIQQPDPVLSLNGVQIQQGTWLDMDDWFSLVNQQAIGPTGVPVFGHEIVRRHFLSPLLYTIYAGASAGGLDERWVRWIGATLQAYRRFFRIPKRWLGAIRALEPNRVAVVDPRNNLKTPPLVLADSAIKYAFAVVLRRLQGGHRWLATNRRSYPRVDDLIESPDAVAAPCLVRIVDDEAGIIELVWDLDPFGERDKTLPCALDEDTIPEADAIAANQLFEYAHLEDDHRVAVVLTGIPAAPNSNDILYSVDIGPGEAEKILGFPIGECRGPIQEVKCSVATAEIAWEDGREEAYETVFLGKEIPGDATVDEIVKRRLPDPINEEKLREIARAAAARVYAPHAPRMEGTAMIDLAPDLVPRGSLGAVTHVVDPDRRAFTTLDFPPLTVQPDFFAYLPDYVRRQLAKVNP